MGYGLSFILIIIDVKSLLMKLIICFELPCYKEVLILKAILSLFKSLVLGCPSRFCLFESLSQAGGQSSGESDESNKRRCSRPSTKGRNMATPPVLSAANEGEALFHLATESSTASATTKAAAEEIDPMFISTSH